MSTPTAVSCPVGTSDAAGAASIPSGFSASETFPGVTTGGVGTTITGSIWAVYQTTSGGSIYTTQVATVTAKAV